MAPCSADPPSAQPSPTASLDGLAGLPANLDADISAGTDAPNSVTEPDDSWYGIITVLSLADPWCPADSKVVLDMEKDNWPEWSLQIEIIASRFGFFHWLEGSLPCPDPSVYPSSHRIWQTNERTLRTFLLEHISNTDYSLVSHHHDSRTIFEELRKRHEQGSIFSQMLLMQKASSIRFNRTTPLGDTVADIDELHERITKMGPLDHDRLLAFCLMNALGEQSRHIPSSVQAKINIPGNSSAAFLQYLKDEDSKIRRHLKQGLRPTVLNLTASATHGNTNKASKLVCLNCKRSNHATDFCIKPGGKMAGKSIDEAHAASGKPPQTRKNRRIRAPPASLPSATSASLAALPLEFHTGIAITGDPCWTACDPVMCLGIDLPRGPVDPVILQ